VNLDQIKKVLSWMTPGPWSWWTSNSFRRLSSDPSGKDGDVMYACVQSDGHPDIAVPNPHDMEGIELLRNEGDALVAEIERLRVESERFRTALEGVLEVCRDRKAFVMLGPMAFSRAEQIALKALGKTR
jgi:hypothetical protein